MYSGKRAFPVLGVCILSVMFPGCVLVPIDAGHEGVLVEKPFIFGHGGVDPVPAKTGRSAIALTTQMIDVDIRPVQYSEHFDIISAETRRCHSMRS
jgi:hypothetical protein